MRQTLLVITLLVNTLLFGQRTCAYDYKNPHLSSVHKHFHHHNRSLTSIEEITIPVVVHVFHRNNASKISKEQVYSQIEALNRDFGRNNLDTVRTPQMFKGLSSDSKIRFALATRDPNDSCSNGIIYINSSLTNHDANDTRKLTARSMWPSDQYLNIYVVQEIESPGGNAIGYAQQPGEDSTTDVVVIAHTSFGMTGTAVRPFHLGRTCVHEVGHWLGLHHVWGNPSIVGSFCDEDDDIEDTPNQKTANYGCVNHPHRSCDNDGDMFMNYLDYQDDSCMYMFTDGQIEKMHYVLRNDERRHRLAEFSINNSYLYRPEIMSYGNNNCDSSILHFEIPIIEEFSTQWMFINTTGDTVMDNADSSNQFNIIVNDKGNISILATINSTCVNDTIKKQFRIFGCTTGLTAKIKKKPYTIVNNKITFESNEYKTIEVIDINGRVIANYSGYLDSLEIKWIKGFYWIKTNIQGEYHVDPIYLR